MLQPRRFTTFLAALFVLASAAAIYKSSTLGWGGAWGPNDTRYKVSPVGISHVLHPRQPVSRVVSASWIPEDGDGRLRAVAADGEGAYARLKLVHPFLRIAFCLALLAAVMLLIVPRQRLIVLVVAAPAFVTLAAVALFVESAKRALAVLGPTDFGFGGSLGVMLVSAAPLLCVLAVTTLFTARLLPIVLGLAGAAWYVDVRFVETWLTAIALPSLLVGTIVILAMRKQEDECSVPVAF